MSAPGNRRAQHRYGNQALILKAWGRLEEHLSCARSKRRCAWSWAIGSDWRNWGLLAREQRDGKTELEKLAAALDIFTDLNMPRERGAVRAELEKTTAADRAT